MTLTREVRTGAALVIAALMVLTAFVWGNQRQVHADGIVDVGQILCFVDEAGNALDGDTGTFPVFRLGDCSDSSPIVDWCPNIPGDQERGDSCIPPEADVCPNIDGLQATVPDGKVLENGECVDEDGGGNGGSASSDLSLSKTVSDASPTPSSTITYSIAVHNAGPDAAQNVTVTDMLPLGAMYVSDDAGGAYASSTGVWTVGTVASGATTTLVITVTNEAVSGLVVTNAASITHSDSGDANSGNNSAEVSFTSTADTQGGGGNSPECSDSQDNDGDGDIDYPADSDCANADDDSEAPASSGNGSSGGRNRRNGGSGRLIGPSGPGEVLGAQTEMCPMFLTGYIKYGADNDAEEVAKLQVFLNAYEANNLQVTGTYDQATLAAVNAFQRKYAQDVLAPWGLQGVTGYVYYTTQKQVNTIFCKFQKDFPLSAAQLEEIAYVREIQPQLRAQGATSVGGAGDASSAAAGQASGPAGSVTLPSIQADENAASATSSQGTASTSTSTAASSPGWFGRFVNWLFGR